MAEDREILGETVKSVKDNLNDPSSSTEQEEEEEGELGY